MLNNIILIWAFNITLICLYDIDVGTIHGISWNPCFMRIQKSIPFRNKTTIIQNHIFSNCEKAFYWTIAALYRDSHIRWQLSLQPYIWNFEDIIGFSGLNISGRTLYVGFSGR